MHNTPQRITLLPAIACAMLALLLVEPVASAQDNVEPKESEPKESAARPWAEGVSQASQATALALFETGNQFFARSQFSQAVGEYENALKEWDHPAIRYNMAVCLINLEQPLEAYTHLVEGLKYKEAISGELFAEGQTYMALLKGNLSWLTISVKEPSTRVSLDGKELFVGPGEARKLMLPGKHQIVAKKPSMLTETLSPVLQGGADTRVVVTMRPLSDGVVLQRRWKTWKPWAVVGGGAGLAAAGGFLYLLAGSNYSTFDARVTEECPDGCPTSGLPNDITDLEDKASLQDTAAVSLLIAGGALAVGGGVLLFFNRERAVTLEQTSTAQSALTIVPLVSPEIVGISSVFRF